MSPAALFIRRTRRRALPGGTVLGESIVVGIGMVLIGNAHAGVSCRLQVGACLMIHVLIAWGSQVLLTMLARLAAGKVGALGAWSSGPQGVGSTLPSFKRPVWILEPRARRQAKEKKDV